MEWAATFGWEPIDLNWGSAFLHCQTDAISWLLRNFQPLPPGVIQRLVRDESHRKVLELYLSELKTNGKQFETAGIGQAWSVFFYKQIPTEFGLRCFAEFGLLSEERIPRLPIRAGELSSGALKFLVSRGVVVDPFPFLMAYLAEDRPDEVLSHLADHPDLVQNPGLIVKLIDAPRTFRRLIELNYLPKIITAESTSGIDPLDLVRFLRRLEYCAPELMSVARRGALKHHVSWSDDLWAHPAGLREEGKRLLKPDREDEEI